MTVDLLVFYLLAATALISALLVVAMKNLVRALFLLFVTLFSMAGLYVFCLADFVALTQIMVYVGGVLVLMLFAFMLSNKALLNDLHKGLHGFLVLPRWQALVVAACFSVILVYMAWYTGEHPAGWILDSSLRNGAFVATDATEKHLGVQLMTRYLLPFEVISIALMMALIGAAHLARKEQVA